jgi:predicted phosphodiesterase
MASKPRPILPSAVDRSYLPFKADPPGTWLVLSDLHLPYHDPETIELAIDLADREKAVGVLLNGDVLDCHELSTFDRDPSAPRYLAERETAIQFQEWLRFRLPDARIIWKDGNHEERLERYLWRHAPALYGLEGLTLPAIMRMKDFGIEHVGDKRVIHLGKLHVIHGHEYRPAIMAPVNPARGLFLRAKGNALCGHWHNTSEHHEPTIAGKPQGCWSVGCACNLNPAYSPLNKWCNGFAMVEVYEKGEFSVRNYRVIGGEIV